MSVLSLPALANAVLWGRAPATICEPPSAFYARGHQPGRPPCCATQPGVCPGGNECPASGICPGSGIRCVGEGRERPNVVLVVSDDQGACHYGANGECRSVQSGTPIPAPATPNLDELSRAGIAFPIAHNTSAWCYPSLNSILTGRYQRSINGARSLASRFHTIPSVLRSLEGEDGATPDPFEPTAAIGGYCSLLGGKFTAAGGRGGFDARTRVGARRLGKLPCVAGAPGQPPRCGSDAPSNADPLGLANIRELFEFIDAMFYPVPGKPGTFANQPFFIWYAPRIPHAPLRSPAVVRQYLFGGDRAGLGGFFQLGALCAGGSCPAAVDAFRESNIGSQPDFYASVWWVDDNLREIRKYLARKGAPHCISRSGASRLLATSPAQCTGGTWASELVSPVDRNTVLVYLSDNGWFLPDSKHSFTENGYRTRLVVYDPRHTPATPTAGPVRESPQLAHATDLLPTILGLALDTPGSQACPRSEDGTPCDGRDLRPYLAPEDREPDQPLRHALCGHATQRGTAPSRQRYLLTRPGSVGRCVDTSLPSCTTAADCDAGHLCLGGHCTPSAEPACGGAVKCAKGAACLGGVCRVGPPCLDDTSCGALLSSAAAACAEKQTRWCRNAPNTPCAETADCPACPALAGAKPAPCGRVCEARSLKLYVGTGGAAAMVDLFDDPDERRRRIGDDPLLLQMSSPNGPYGQDVRRLSCCIDDWWPEGSRGGSLCDARTPCPADLRCNR